MSSTTVKIKGCKQTNPLCDDDLSDITKQEIIFWARKLRLTPSELFRLSEFELDKKLTEVQEEEFATKQEGLAQWKERLNKLNKMQRLKSNDTYVVKGEANRSIWDILAEAAREIEAMYGVPKTKPESAKSPRSLQNQTSDENQVERSKTWIDKSDTITLSTPVHQHFDIGATVENGIIGDGVGASNKKLYSPMPPGTRNALLPSGAEEQRRGLAKDGGDFWVPPHLSVETSSVYKPNEAQPSQHSQQSYENINKSKSCVTYASKTGTWTSTHSAMENVESGAECDCKANEKPKGIFLYGGGQSPSRTSERPPGFHKPNCCAYEPAGAPKYSHQQCVMCCPRTNPDNMCRSSSPYDFNWIGTCFCDHSDPLLRKSGDTNAGMVHGEDFSSEVHSSNRTYTMPSDMALPSSPLGTRSYVIRRGSQESSQIPIGSISRRGELEHPTNQAAK